MATLVFNISMAKYFCYYSIRSFSIQTTISQSIIHFIFAQISIQRKWNLTAVDKKRQNDTRLYMHMRRSYFKFEDSSMAITLVNVLGKIPKVTLFKVLRV